MTFTHFRTPKLYENYILGMKIVHVIDNLVDLGLN